MIFSPRNLKCLMTRNLFFLHPENSKYDFIIIIYIYITVILYNGGFDVNTLYFSHVII